MQSGLVVAYLDCLRTQRKLSAHTVAAYERDLQQLLQLAAALPERPTLRDLRQHQVRTLAARLHAAGLGPRSIARKLSSWRGFYGWMAENDAPAARLAANPVDGVKAPRRNKPLPKALSADDAIRLVAQTAPGKNPRDPAESCNQAMFELLYSSGLRVSELVGLDVHFVRAGGYQSAGWIDLPSREVTVTGKGGKMRQVPIGQAAVQALSAWLAIRTTIRTQRGPQASADPHALFLTSRGTRMSARLVQARIKRHAQALGLPTQVHPHMLRHSFASHVLQSSGDLRAVQEMLGHASIASTQVYTALDFQRLAQVYDQAHPRARKRQP